MAIDQIGTNGLVAADIIPADGSISTAKIAADAVTSAKIAADAITTAKIAADAVTDAKLGFNPGLKSVQVFASAGTTTWTKPSGIKLVKVIVTGGGGGGGRANATDSASGTAGSGGGGGGTAIKLIDVSAVSSVSVTVGDRGIGSPSDGVQGTAGGTSSFGSYCSATGGGGGLSNAVSGYSATNNNGGARGQATGGDVNIDGTQGQDALGAGTGGVAVGLGGSGGGSFWGSNIDEARGDSNISGNGQPGRTGQYGVGGSGGAETNNKGTSSGGNGQTGVVYVEEYA